MPLRLSELTGQSAVAYRNDPMILGLASDSRIVKPGFLFAALPGVANDGAAFAKNAVEKGAVAILADRAMEDLPVPVIVSANPRLALAQMAKAFHHGQQPDMMAAVTGTNGKTSTAHFIRQIWSLCGHKAASLGTLGVTAPDWNDKGGLTTPDTVTLHDTLSRLHDSGVSHACMEVQGVLAGRQLMGKQRQDTSGKGGRRKSSAWNSCTTSIPPNTTGRLPRGGNSRKSSPSLRR